MGTLSPPRRLSVRENTSVLRLVFSADDKRSLTLVTLRPAPPREMGRRCQLRRETLCQLQSPVGRTPPKLLMFVFPALEDATQSAHVPVPEVENSTQPAPAPVPVPIPSVREATQPVPVASVEGAMLLLPVLGVEDTTQLAPVPVPVPDMRDATRPDPVPFPGVRDDTHPDPVPVPSVRDAASPDPVPVPGVRDAAHLVPRSVPVAKHPVLLDPPQNTVAAPPDLPDPPQNTAAAPPDLPLIAAAVSLDLPAAPLNAAAAPLDLSLNFFVYSLCPSALCLVFIPPRVSSPVQALCITRDSVAVPHLTLSSSRLYHPNLAPHFAPDPAFPVAIHGYRETERLQWGSVCAGVLARVRAIAFQAGSPLLGPVHVLDLDKTGYIKPHVDSVKFCGSTIAGLSLLSDSVMRLVREERTADWVDLFLSRRSLYILRDDVRFKFTHEILKDEDSFFSGHRVPRHRRISIICRNLPI
ncbi:hypothetical protein P4O66_007402 [Electrophorus voltai]|uniref:Alpha-ketoglutarate-dependent dioxygenase AlkB-like domain-containing protein n=1 Tax=Electrophorus voltai TaxID=2609070 RepID=A0AAD8ZHM1_9TELE|nr:hypothetical protein P4O66_007402 [Electrophorus voltai]